MRNTDHTSSQDETKEKAEEKEKEEEVKADIKSNNPHLTGGEKHCVFFFPAKIGNIPVFFSIFLSNQRKKHCNICFGKKFPSTQGFSLRA